MIGRIFALLWWVLTLPIKLVLLPFQVLSAVISLVIYGIALAFIFGIVYFLVL